MAAMSLQGENRQNLAEQEQERVRTSRAISAFGRCRQGSESWASSDNGDTPTLRSSPQDDRKSQSTSDDDQEEEIIPQRNGDREHEASHRREACTSGLLVQFGELRVAKVTRYVIARITATIRIADR